MNLDIKKIEALCFDIDGTLRDTDDQYVEKIERILSPFKVIISKNKISSFARWLVMFSETPANFLMTIPDILGFDDKLLKEEKVENFNTEKMEMILGVEQTLKTLSIHYKMAIVSARRESKVVEFVVQNSLEEFFPVVVSALSAKRNKPHPGPVLFAAEQLKVVPENILMIGDTTFDILSGKRAGAQTVAVLSGFGTERELKKAGADIVLDSVADLPNILLP